MNNHKNAKLRARGREEMVRRLAACSPGSMAADCGLRARTVKKWKYRYAAGGVEPLANASSRPKRRSATARPAPQGPPAPLPRKDAPGQARRQADTRSPGRDRRPLPAPAKGSRSVAPRAPSASGSSRRAGQRWARPQGPPGA